MQVLPLIALRRRSIFLRIALLLLPVTHSEYQVKNLCTKAILLEKGKLTASGTLDEVLPLYREIIK